MQGFFNSKNSRPKAKPAKNRRGTHNGPTIRPTTIPSRLLLLWIHEIEWESRKLID